MSFLAPRDDAQAPTASQRLVNFFSAQSPPAWLWRIPAAILAFPLAYFIFGAMIAPIVVPTYRAGIAGLVLPPLSTILPVQLVRSTLFLLASLPFLILWKGKSRLTYLLSRPRALVHRRPFWTLAIASVLHDPANCPLPRNWRRLFRLCGTLGPPALSAHRHQARNRAHCRANVSIVVRQYYRSPFRPTPNIKRYAGRLCLFTSLGRVVAPNPFLASVQWRLLLKKMMPRSPLPPPAIPSTKLPPIPPDRSRSLSRFRSV